MKIAVMGASGRMGQSIIKVIQDGYPNHLGNEDNASVIIDFTAPEALEKHCKLAVKNNTPLVIGTTGLNQEHFAVINDASKNIAIVYSANMSLGVNILLSLVEKTAAILSYDFDIEIFEAHHKHKKDAPSGTAIALGKSAAKGRNIQNYQPNYHDRTGQRETGEIGYSVMRGGDIIGEHNVIFAGESERIEIGHKASNRNVFAKGAVHAALWTKDKKAGLYSMQDVLGL